MRAIIVMMKCGLIVELKNNKKCVGCFYLFLGVHGGVGSFWELLVPYLSKYSLSFSTSFSHEV